MSQFCTKESEIVRISRNNSIFGVFGEAHFYILKRFCSCSIISFSFYIKNSLKEYRKKIFGFIFWTPIPVQTLPEHFRMQYCVVIYLIFT